MLANKQEIMRLGLNLAEVTSLKGHRGGPFGAVIVKDGVAIAIESNSVLHDNDPTAHAEINVIRAACKHLGTHDLSGCELYTTCYPCPMCLSAIIWANIKTVYYGCTAEDAADIGFRDDFIYKFIESGRKDDSILDMSEICREDCLPLFQNIRIHKERCTNTTLYTVELI